MVGPLEAVVEVGQALLTEELERYDSAEKAVVLVVQKGQPKEVLLAEEVLLEVGEVRCLVKAHQAVSEEVKQTALKAAGEQHCLVSLGLWLEEGKNGQLRT